MDKIKLLLVDDHTLFREGLARLLEGERDLELVGTYSSIEQAIEALARKTVHVVLLDFELGDKNGFDFFRMFKEKQFTGRILLVTGGVSTADTFRLIKQGAAGIFLKHNPPSELVIAIRRVARGETWMDSSNLNSLVELNDARSQQSTPPLNSREQAVLKGIFEGLTNKEIASRLDISESYVKATLQQLFTKTGVRTRAQLVRVAIEKQLD